MLARSCNALTPLSTSNLPSSLDWNQGKVKQIVGSTLKDLPCNSTGTDAEPQTNFETEKLPSEFAELYAKDNITGGHVIMLSRAPPTPLTLCNLHATFLTVDLPRLVAPLGGWLQSLDNWLFTRVRGDNLLLRLFTSLGPWHKPEPGPDGAFCLGECSGRRDQGSRVQRARSVSWWTPGTALHVPHNSPAVVRSRLPSQAPRFRWRFACNPICCTVLMKGAGTEA